jgi:integrase
VPLSDVSNAALKQPIDKMAEGGLAPKTIVNYAQVPKMVLASGVDDEGDQIYPREWNHDFVGLPIVDKSKQPRPTVNETEIADIISRAKSRIAVLVCLLAGSGLRIGEALALKATDFSPDFRVIRVTRSIWRTREQAPKTQAAVREVDIAEPLAALFRAYAEAGAVTCSELRTGGHSHNGMLTARPVEDSISSEGSAPKRYARLGYLRT